MIYLEEEKNVRPAWMPWKNDYRCLKTEELETIEDCEEAIAWLQARMNDLHDKKAVAADERSDKAVGWHIARCHAVRNEVYSLLRQYMREDEEERRREAEERHRTAVEAWDAKMKAMMDSITDPETRDAFIEAERQRTERHRLTQAHEIAMAQAKKAANVQATHAEQMAIVQKKHDLKMERIAASASRDTGFKDHLRAVIMERHGPEYWLELAAEAGAREDEQRAGGEQ